MSQLLRARTASHREGGAAPDVSIVIGAYNAMPYLTACLQSVVEQSLGLDRLEIIAIDDGSTDGTGDELDKFAAKHPGRVRVVHQENSGSPSGPRNVGLELATGRYVFFLDADDYLGGEALERMVAMADEQDADVVLGKMVGVNGRGVPESMFTRTQPQADLYSSRVWWTLSATKLFRRSHVVGLGLRFPTHYRIGEDQMFTARAYFAARAIAVVADHGCYYATRRDDGGNITAVDTDLERRLRFLKEMCALVGEQVEAGPRRDYLLRRQFGIDLAGWTGRSLLRKEPAEQDRLLAQAAEIIQGWGTDGVLEPMRALLRLRFHLIGRGLFHEALEVLRFEMTAAASHDVVLENGVAYATYPFFRDAELRVPDSCYDITRQLKTVHHLHHLDVDGSVVRLAGHAYVQRLEGSDDVTELLLRERDSGVEHLLPTERVATPELAEGSGEQRHAYPRAGFAVDIDLATAAGGDPLPRGLWDVHLVLRNRGLRREVRLGNRRSSQVDATTRTHIASLGPAQAIAFTTYFTKPYSNLTVDVDAAKHQLDNCLGAPDVRWSQSGHALVVSGTLDVEQAADGVVSLMLRGENGAVRRFPAVLQDGGYRVTVPTASVPTGRWAVSLSLDLATGRRETAVARPGAMPPARWRRGWRPFYAKVGGAKRHMELRVAPVDIVAGVRHRVGKAIRRG